MNKNLFTNLAKLYLLAQYHNQTWVEQLNAPLHHVIAFVHAWPTLLITRIYSLPFVQIREGVMTQCGVRPQPYCIRCSAGQTGCDRGAMSHEVLRESIRCCWRGLRGPCGPYMKMDACKEHYASLLEYFKLFSLGFLQTVMWRYMTWCWFRSSALGVFLQGTLLIQDWNSYILQNINISISLSLLY